MLLLVEGARPHHEAMGVPSHGAAISILGGADDGGGAHVERNAGQDGSGGHDLTGPEHVIIERIAMTTDHLDARGVVDIGDRGDVMPRDVGPVDSLQVLLRR